MQGTNYTGDGVAEKPLGGLGQKQEAGGRGFPESKGSDYSAEAWRNHIQEKLRPRLDTLLETDRQREGKAGLFIILPHVLVCCLCVPLVKPSQNHLR